MSPSDAQKTENGERVKISSSVFPKCRTHFGSGTFQKMGDASS